MPSTEGVQDRHTGRLRERPGGVMRSRQGLRSHHRHP